MSALKDRDPCMDHTLVAGLCCGDCFTVDRRRRPSSYRARSSRGFFTVEDIERWNVLKGVTK